MCNFDCPLASAGAADRVAEHGRREFLQQSLLAAAAALLTAACGDGVIGGAGPTAPVILGTSFTVRVADYPALSAVGGIAIVNSSSSNPIALARTGVNSFVALSLICPHAGYKPVDVRSGTGFRCPNHGATFDYTGKWTGGQRTRNMQSYPTTYNAGAGTVTIG